MNVSVKNGKVYLKRQRINGDKITDGGATEILATMNQTSYVKTRMFRGNILEQIKRRHV